MNACQCDSHFGKQETAIIYRYQVPVSPFTNKSWIKTIHKRYRCPLKWKTDDVPVIRKSILK